MLRLISIIIEELKQFFTISIVDINRLFFEDNIVYFFMFILSFVYVYFNRSRLKAGYQFLIPFTIGSLLIIYNPLILMVEQKSSSINIPVISRLFIVCPFWLLMSYGLTEISAKYKNRFRRIACALLLSFLLIISGDTVGSKLMVRNPDNIYKISDSAIEIADAVLELSNDEPTSLWLFIPENDVGEKFVEGGTIFEGIRQYTAKIQLFRWCYTDEYWNDYFVSNNMSSEYIGAIIDGNLQNQEIEYMAFPINDCVDAKMRSLGYECQIQVGGYNIYRLVY